MYAVGVKIDDTPLGIELERTYAVRSALSCKRIARQDDCEIVSLDKNRKAMKTLVMVEQ